MTIAEQMAQFVERASYIDLSPEACQQLKLRILDSLGCAIGAVEGLPARVVREHVEEVGKEGSCSLVGGGTKPPELAAVYNGVLVRYLDFNDSYLAKGETCHPSDNLAAVLAASEYARASGKDLLTALAVAYQVQCRLSDEAPVRSKGFDHTTQGSFAVAAGVSKALGLDRERTANAIAISGTAFNALRVTRTGALSHWKGLAYPNAAFGATHATLLAMRGITGPKEVFEGNKGFMESISGRFKIDWESEKLEAVTKTMIKRFNAETHSQSTLEGLLELQEEYGFRPVDVVRIEVDTFDVAYNIIGGGEEGDKTIVHTKEEADHSMQYMVAVALLDGEVMPEQYRPERIVGEDVQQLLQKVTVRPVGIYSQRFPDEMPSRITVILANGDKLSIEKRDFQGFPTRPMSWDSVAQKFERLSRTYTDPALRQNIIQVVAGLEAVPVSDLTALVRQVRVPT
jgi:2-methylcitrate dehydratase